MRYAIVQDGKVVNVVLWDGESEWSPGDDYSAIDCSDEVGIGWLWNSEDSFHQVIVEDPA